MARDSDNPAQTAPTPMIAQYLALRAEVPGCLLFYRMGDFFELFFDDAKVAASTLDIALTARGDHDGAPIPMCGVPVHAADVYLARLIRAGHRVAIAEQTESPADAKKRSGKTLVSRAIVRVVTAGTLTEDTLLEPASTNWLVALAQAGDAIGIAAADVSTGRFETTCCAPAELESELARIDPAEIVAPEPLTMREHTRVEEGFDSLRGEAALKTRFGVATLDGFGRFSRAELAAAGGLLAYLGQAAREGTTLLQPPVSVVRASHMAIDEATRDSLELCSIAGGGRKGSLLHCIDRTVTGAGARLLGADLSAPLTDIAVIGARLDLVAWFDTGRRDAARTALKALPDAGRALGRLAAGRGSPRDLAQLRDSLDGARALHDRLSAEPDAPALLADLLPALTGHGALTDRLARALVPSPSTETDRGGYIAEGFDAALDALRAAGGEGRRAIAQLESRYRDATSTPSLKIRHNAVLGFHIEVQARHADKLMAADSGFTHRQTLAGVVRFNAPDLHEVALRVTQSGAHAVAAEAAHLEELTALAMARAPAIAATCDALARIDVAAGLATLADEANWCRPAFVDRSCFEVEGGRHPVVEAALRAASARFIANDCRLSADARVWLVTGPNMGGKSTFLRQNALIAVLAQAGSFVPATAAKLGIVDRLFSRVGASDNLAKGRSTFMVEMVETAAILSQATPNSLVILDEVGRGTSTYDGLAIAWAVLEAIHDANRCRCLFATHYHELTRLASKLDALSLHHVRAREYKGELVFLHEVERGEAMQSYGLAVAKLAGLPAPVVARARAVLAKLEQGRAATGGIAAGLDDLPLFAALAEPAPDPLRTALGAIDIDALSPRDALAALYDLKRAAATE